MGCSTRIHESALGSERHDGLVDAQLHAHVWPWVGWLQGCWQGHGPVEVCFISVRMTAVNAPCGAAETAQHLQMRLQAWVAQQHPWPAYITLICLQWFGEGQWRTLLPALVDGAGLLAAAWALLVATLGGAVAAMLSLSRSTSSDALPVALRLRSLHCACSSRYDRPSTSCNVNRAIVADDQSRWVNMSVWRRPATKSCDDDDQMMARPPRRTRAP